MELAFYMPDLPFFRVRIMLAEHTNFARRHNKTPHFLQVQPLL